ncbi:MAG: GntR family transcriptional regulator, partial [Cetobacterium sp.]
MTKNKYLEIYNFIKKNIDEGIYKPEDKIPSENVLKDMFSVSRNTVRKAIELLASNGLLSSVHGKGVFVMKKIPVNFLLGGSESFKEASLKNNLKYKTTLIKFEDLVVDKELSEKSHFSIGQKVIHLIRIREINGEQIILDDNYFLEEVVKGIDSDIVLDSIYEFLENKKSIKINGAQKIISVESP